MNELANGHYRHIETQKIAGALGAEITGVDLSQNISDDVLEEIRGALHENLVVFFREQTLTPGQQLAFARRWGDIHLHPFLEGIADYPEILEIKKADGDKRNFGGSWHTDQMFAPRPAMGTMLYALKVPEYGGDTMWTNQYLAYEALSDAMRKLIGPLKIVAMGEGTPKYGGKSRKDFYADRLTTVKVIDPGDLQTNSVHPLVRTHPGTGRRALYIGSHVNHFDGMTEAESQPLIEFLTRHSTRPEFTCRFRWSEGALAFWDNRCTQHFAINDYPAGTRRMHRITVRGDVPV